MTTAELLKAARERISVPERWAKGHTAYTACGEITSAQDPSAVCWCAWGAIRLVGQTVSEAKDTMHLLTRLLRDEGYGNGLINFNDEPETSHRDILALFDRAIALAEQEAQP